MAGRGWAAMTMKPSPRIELEIDALILDGLSPREGALFAAAFRDELTRLLLTEGMPATVDQMATGRDGLPLAAVDGGVIAAPPGLAPEALGAHAAGALYRGLDGGAS
jgi:hypothetical protein